MKKVSIFRTDADNQKLADYLVLILHEDHPNLKINFDLDDADNILRVEGSNFESTDIMRSLNSLGFLCEELVSASFLT